MEWVYGYVHWACLLVRLWSEICLGVILATLPDTFDTPMFWSVEEIEELRGTAIFGTYSLTPSLLLLNTPSLPTQIK